MMSMMKKTMKMNKKESSQVNYRDEQAPLPEIDYAIVECTSIEEARSRGALMWNIEHDDIEVTVLTENKKFFGLLGANLKVEMRPFAPVSYIKSCHLINKILERMDLDLIPELNDEGMINLVGEDAGVVIGRYGETLKALEYLTNLICHYDMSARRVRLDCGGYRKRREQSLARLAESVAREAVRKGSPVSLEPMSSWERRLVHIALRDSAEVETKSVGEEPSRRVVVCPTSNTAFEAGELRRRPRGRNTQNNR